MSVLPALHRNHTLFELPLYFCQFSWVAWIVQIFKTISIRTDWTIGCFKFCYFVLWFCQWMLYIAWIYHIGLHWNCIWMVLCKFSFRYNSSWIVSTIAISIWTDWTIGYFFYFLCEFANHESCTLHTWIYIILDSVETFVWHPIWY